MAGHITWSRQFSPISRQRSMCQLSVAQWSSIDSLTDVTRLNWRCQFIAARRGTASRRSSCRSIKRCAALIDARRGTVTHRATITRLNFFEVARAAFFSKCSPRQDVRSSARRTSLLTMVNWFTILILHSSARPSSQLPVIHLADLAKMLIHDANPSQLWPVLMD